MFVEKLKAVIDDNHLTKYINIVEEIVDDDYNSMDIAAALLKMSLGDLSTNNVKDEDIEDTGSSEESMARLFINVGRKDGIRPKDVLGAIAGETGIPGKVIGTIDIYDNYTFVEVPKEYAKEVLFRMKNNQIKGNKINIEPAKVKK